METLYQTGNTVRLYCTFTKTIDGEEVLTNPHNVIFRVMNYKYEVLEEFLLDESTNSSSIGEWFYDFTLPLEEGRYIYEWQGYINDRKFDQRKTIRTTFI